MTTIHARTYAWFHLTFSELCVSTASEAVLEQLQQLFRNRCNSCSGTAYSWFHFTFPGYMCRQLFVYSWVYPLFSCLFFTSYPSDTLPFFYPLFSSFPFFNISFLSFFIQSTPSLPSFLFYSSFSSHSLLFFLLLLFPLSCLLLSLRSPFSFSLFLFGSCT